MSTCLCRFAGHHRYPVWWTGDGVPLMGDVGAMVHEAVHDFRPYVLNANHPHGELGAALRRCGVAAWRRGRD